MHRVQSITGVLVQYKLYCTANTMKSSSVKLSLVFSGEKSETTKISHDEVSENSSQRCSRCMQTQALSYLVAYFNVGYFTCFVPFRYEYSYINDYYELVENNIQKVGSMLFHAAYALQNILYFANRLVLYNSSPVQNPLQFLNFAENTINIFYAFALSKALLFKSHDFRILLDLCQKHGTTTNECQQRVSNMKFIWEYGICAYFIIVGYINYSELSQFYSDINRGDNFIPENIRRILFVTVVYGRSVGESASVLLFGLGWLLKNLCEDLRNELLGNKTSYTKIMEQYLSIKAINERINLISKYLIFYYTVGSVPFISDVMMDVSISQPFLALSFIFTLSSYVASMLGSAEANKKAAELKDALILRNNNKSLLAGESKDDMLRVSILLSEFSTPSIGLKGMDFFTVTYGFLGVMLAQCIVYALIILQLKVEADPKKN